MRSVLASAIDGIGLDATDRQVAQLVEFVAMLAKWNRTYNLTAIRSPADMLTHHVIDCLAVIAPLRRQRGDRMNDRLLDVGSGGGLPGVVIAVMEPSTAVTCLDAVGKKAAFVRQAATSIGLHNLRSEHARVETFRADPFHVVTSRAFASLHDFVRSTEHLLAPDGVWMAMKGKRPDDEIAALPDNVAMFHVEPIEPPNRIGERCLVWMRPASRVAQSKRPL